MRACSSRAPVHTPDGRSVRRTGDVLTRSVCRIQSAAESGRRSSLQINFVFPRTVWFCIYALSDKPDRSIDWQRLMTWRRPVKRRRRRGRKRGRSQSKLGSQRGLRGCWWEKFTKTREFRFWMSLNTVTVIVYMFVCLFVCLFACLLVFIGAGLGWFKDDCSFNREREREEFH